MRTLISDVDSLGAAIGIYCAAKVLGKKAQIVLNEITSSLRPLVECFTEEKGYPADLFIKNEEALMLTNENTLVVVVDVNRILDHLICLSVMIEYTDGLRAL